MKAHVFVVNDNTFPSHLQYLFAGTGAKEKDEDISLLADIKRVRPGDFVIFYIEATAKTKGGFYGIFKIAKETPLVFYTPGRKGFCPNLGKKLIYRTSIEPYEVYADGVPEWEVLDKLPIYATEIQWSLIYRKLKGKRGCTPLLPWEAERLINQIREKNKGKLIADVNFKGSFNWSKKDRKIIISPEKKFYPCSKTFNSNPLSRLYNLQRQKRAYEKYLQLYFMENIENSDLIPIVGENLLWFGNEVACGVGMQKIDILTICQKNKERKEYRIIELKDEPIDPKVVWQIEYYVNWASQNSGRHLKDAFSWNIQPIIVAPPLNSKNWQNIVKIFQTYNLKQISLPLLYFEFKINEKNQIIFERKY